MDYTGLDVAQAKEQIYNLYDQGKRLANDFSSAEEEFWLKLSRQWQAPNAKLFQTDLAAPLYNISLTALKALFEVCRDAVIAYNNLAQSLGSPTIDDGYFTDSNPDKPNDKHPGGGVGLSDGGGKAAVMDVDGVELTNLWFREQFDALIKGFNGLPMNIAFYDPDGSIAASYQTRIKDAATEVETLSNKVYSRLDEEIANYRQSVNTGKEQAVQSFTAKG